MLPVTSPSAVKIIVSIKFLLNIFGKIAEMAPQRLRLQYCGAASQFFAKGLKPFSTCLWYRLHLVVLLYCPGRFGPGCRFVRNYFCPGRRLSMCLLPYTFPFCEEIAFAAQKQKNPTQVMSGFAISLAVVVRRPNNKLQVTG